MTYLRSPHPIVIPITNLFQSTAKTISVAAAFTLFAVCARAQEQPAPAVQPSTPPQLQNANPTITIPPGTGIALVLTQPVQSRHVRRGDDMYAQITSPVDSGSQMVIPPGTFVQGVIDRVDREGGRGELRLTSMSITFPDGYVTPIAGPITLRTDEGYAIKDPGSNRTVAAFALPAAGAGLGALIGHSVGTADSSTTSLFPPGCVGPPPYCTTTTMPTFGTKTKDAIIGAGVGGLIGGVASMAMILGSHHFYLDAGAPIQMTLQQPLTLQQDEVAKAVQQYGQGPVAIQPVEPRPVPPPPPDTGPDVSPATSPGPPTVIPGIPPGF